MTATAEAYGFGARAPYATPRASEYDMKERVRLSGLFPRVRNEPMSKQLQVLLKEFEQNAALTGILERRRRLEERTQYELKGREGMDALNRNLAPPFRAGMAGAATSAEVASRIVQAQRDGLAARARRPQLKTSDAADVMTGKAGVSSTGGSVSSTDPLPRSQSVPAVRPRGAQPDAIQQESRKTSRVLGTRGDRRHRRRRRRKHARRPHCSS